jgi:hypothetical protein
MAASKSSDTYVSKVTEAKVYGESQYNTLDYDQKLNWAIYSVDESFKFVFKNKLTQKYIQAVSVATISDNEGKVQNVKYVDENATVFTLESGVGTRENTYALKASVGETDGYLCSTVANYGYVTHYDKTDHNGAWVEFAEDPGYFSLIHDILFGISLKFGKDQDCVMLDDIQAIETDLNENTHVDYEAFDDIMSFINSKIITVQLEEFEELFIKSENKSFEEYVECLAKEGEINE